MSAWDDDEPIDLPPEAGSDGREGYEPNDEWLAGADAELQKEVMRRWFSTRYWDPANDTPHDSEEGGYLYIWGGPYDASDELNSRFSDIVDEDCIDEVVEELEQDGITEWAPIHTEPDYDDAFELSVLFREGARKNFSSKLADFDALRAINPGANLQPGMRQLLYSSLITALEAYLAETLSFWTTDDKNAFRNLVEHSKEFRDRKLAVSEIFKRQEALKDEVDRYLQSLIWHRLDAVGPLFDAALGVKFPDIGPLMKRILVRHDIVHRGGKTKDGQQVHVTEADLDGLRTEISDFVRAIEQHIDKLYPKVAEEPF
jgi:hypothetical protein